MECAHLSCLATHVIGGFNNVPVQLVCTFVCGVQRGVECREESQTKILQEPHLCLGSRQALLQGSLLLGGLVSMLLGALGLGTLLGSSLLLSPAARIKRTSQFLHYRCGYLSSSVPKGQLYLTGVNKAVAWCTLQRKPDQLRHSPFCNLQCSLNSN